MKSLIRHGATLVAVGGMVLGTLLGAGSRAIALTQEQVVQQLRHVPVFTITDEEGAPLVSEVPDREDIAPVARVFISRSDAQAFLDNLRANNPDLGEAVQVTPVSLARVYEVAVAGQDPENRLEFVFVPMADQVESAVNVLQEERIEGGGELLEEGEFSGVPLFTARVAGEGEEGGGYLTIEVGEQQVIPLFFTQEELQSLLDRIGASQPDLAATLSPHIIRLEDLIHTLEASDNADLQQIQLIPPQESIDFIREATSGQPEGQPEE
ncbi:MAG: Tic22 family protein [Synechococcales bacterium]|nr:Tic22 family protein [Synechococcales bacterium]